MYQYEDVSKSENNSGVFGGLTGANNKHRNEEMDYVLKRVDQIVKSSTPRNERCHNNLTLALAEENIFFLIFVGLPKQIFLIESQITLTFNVFIAAKAKRDHRHRIYEQNVLTFIVPK